MGLWYIQSLCDNNSTEEGGDREILEQSYYVLMKLVLI